VLPCDVKDFETYQSNHLKDMEETLLNDWRRGIKDNLMDQLQDQFNLFESSLDTYRVSPLANLLKLLEIVMLDQMRGLVVTSIREWVDFIRKFVLADNVSSLSGERNYWSKSLFKVVIGVKDGGDTVEITPPIQDLENSLVNVIDVMVDIANKVISVK
jgi:hypothetical protein